MVSAASGATPELFSPPAGQKLSNGRNGPETPEPAGGSAGWLAGWLAIIRFHFALLITPCLEEGGRMPVVRRVV